MSVTGLGNPHLYPALFSPTGAVEIDPGDGPGFDTPLGRMVFVVSEFGEPVDLTAAWRTGPYTVWQWANGVEVLLNPRLAVTLLPPGLSVSGMAGAMVRALPRAAGMTEVACLWSPRRPTWTYRVASGQNLTTSNWSNGTTRVTLGLPHPDDAPDDAIELRDDGYLVAVPPTAGQFQTHFVYAWALARSDSLGAWFAVDCQPEDLLALAD